MASAPTAQEALRAWLNLLPPDQRQAAESVMGAGWLASADAPAEPTPSPSQGDPATTPIPEEPRPTQPQSQELLAQQEWYASQDKIFSGSIPPEIPWQDDDLSAHAASSASQQPTVDEALTEPSAPDQEPWLLDTCLFNIFGESFELQVLKDKIAKGQMPHCLFKDPAAGDQQPLNRQEMWAAMQYKPIYRTAGRWTYWDLLPEDVRKPPPQFCNEIEDAPKQPPTSRIQPKEKARPKHVPPSARPSPPPKMPQKDSWADATEQEEASDSTSKPKSVQEPKASSATTSPPQPAMTGTAEQKPEPPPQQHLRPPESQSFLPKEGDPPIKAAPSKPPQTTQPPQVQPGSSDQPGSSNDGGSDLSAADSATVYKPLPGQDLDMDSFRSLDQPGAFTKPYLFDIGLWTGVRSPSSASLRPSLLNAWFMTAAPGSASTAAPRLKKSPKSTTGGTLCTPMTGVAAYKVGLSSSFRISCA